MSTRRPDSISDLIERPRHLLFLVGAGVSARHPSSYPLWHAAVQQILEDATSQGFPDALRPAFQYYVDNARHYDAVDLVEGNLTPVAFDRLIERVFGDRDRPPNHLHGLLAEVQNAAYWTTNFDKCLDAALYRHSGKMPRLASYHDEDRVTAIAAHETDPYVVKLHGDIDSPSRIVITRRRLNGMHRLSHLERLFSAALGERQLIVIGYGLRDPDFHAYWDRVLDPRTLRYEGLVCCAEGSLDPERCSELASRNLRVLEFENNNGKYEFVEKVLETLVEMARQRVTSVGDPVRETRERQADDSLILELFGESRPDRYQTLLEALCIECLASTETGALAIEEIKKSVGELLGVGGNLANESITAALAHLVDEGLAEFTRDGVIVAAETRQRIEALRNTLREKEELVLRGVLRDVVDDELDVSRLLPRFRRVVDELLLWLGEDLAQQVLFARVPGKDLSERVSEIVEDATGNDGQVASALSKAAERLIFEMRAEEEDWFFRKVQAHFLVRAHVLHPHTDALLKDFAARHILYIDSSVVLPALAQRHPLSRAFTALLARTRSLGIEMRMMNGVFSEVTGHINLALRQFEELSIGDFRENLKAYNLCTGTAAGNVFLEGLHESLATEELVGWRGYMRHLTKTTGGQYRADEERIRVLLREAYGVDVVGESLDTSDEEEIARLERSILEHRPNRRRQAAGTALTRHEATQLFTIRRERDANPSHAHLVWFLTTDTHVSRLQLSLGGDGEFRLPAAYHPARWSIYLNTVDFRARSSKGFAALMKRVQFGPVSGGAAIDLIRMTYDRVHNTDLENRAAALLQGIICQFHEEHGKETPDGILLGVTEEERCQAVRHEVESLVVKRLDEIESTQERLQKLESEAEERQIEHEQDVEKLRRQIARKDHHISVLKAELRSSRGG